MTRPTIAAIAAAIAVVAGLWALALAVFGGVDLHLLRGQIQITSNEPERPALVSLGALVVAAYLYGAARAAARWHALTGRLRDRWLAAVMTGAALALGIGWGATSVGGSDSYGYASAAEAWLQHRLKDPQPWADQVPWPSPAQTFAPLAYRAIESSGHTLNVPIVSPGLPILMAAAKLAGGQRALFLVVPVVGCLLVLATWGLGCRLGSSRAGVIAAGLVATSPIFLWTLFSPMTDAPVAALWAGAFYFLLGHGRRAAAVAGVLAAMAVLVRPNLVYLDAIMALWFFVRRDPDATTGRRLADAVSFGIPALAGPLSIAIFYTYLYGSPTTSGYGGVSDAWLPANIFTNVRNYLIWSAQTQTLLALAGLAVLVLPARRIWSGLRDRRALALIAVAVSAIYVQYGAYLVFDRWTALRLLLPVWPFMMLGLARLVVSAVAAAPAMTVAVVCVVAGLGLHNLRFADREFVFDLWREHRTFAAAGALVRDVTPPNSAVFAKEHSGSVRYYGGRITIRYDLMDRSWLDRSVAWLDARGVHVYAVLDEWDVDTFRRQFAGQHTVARLDTPLAVYQGVHSVMLFDLSGPSPAASRLVSEPWDDRHRAMVPVPPPSLTFAP